MTIKAKLLGGGIMISLLLIAVLILAVLSFSSLNGGFAEVVKKSATGVDNSRNTQSHLAEADNNLSRISEGMLAVVDDIQRTNMQVKVLERKIKALSTTLNSMTKDASLAAEELPDGDARYAVEDLADAIGDVEESMRREALVSLTRTVGKMAEFTENIGIQVNGIKRLWAELGDVKELSSDVVSANLEIRGLAENFSGEIRVSRNVIVSVLLMIAVICLVSVLLLRRAIIGPLTRANEIARGIADGNLDQDVNILGKDEIGQLGTSMSVMIKNLKQDIEQTRRRADEASRIRMALDVCSTNVVVADREHRVIYQNHASRQTLSETQEVLSSELPELSAEHFIGSDISHFHPDAQSQRRRIEQLEAASQQDVQIAGRHLRLIATPVFSDSRERLGTAMEWTDRTEEVARERQEKARIEADARIANENLRIRVALDNVSSSVMMADTERKIHYINRAAQALFSDAEADIRKELPGFQADRLLHASIDAFHKDPTHQAELLANLKSRHTSELQIGGRTMRIVANPVVNDSGERLGTAVEWRERTAEVAVEAEVEAIVTAAQRGDLSQRIDLGSKVGFFKELGIGINALIDQVETIFNDLSGVMAAMAQGDLTHAVQNAYRGQFDQLKQHVNGTLENLRGTLGELRVSMDEMRTTADEISSGNNNLSARSEQQASSLEETASSMEQLTSTVRNNADNAQQANQLAANARAKAEQGGEVVSRAVLAMREINTASARIGEIIGVIDAIAFQTNLLALNASVEAARAGEQGRGFAVVATEVRNLAGRSATAAKEIKELIKDSGEKVNLGADLVNKSGATLEEIVEAVKKVGDIIAEIAAASAQQSAGIDQVNQAVTSMDEVTQQNAALAEQTSAASASMSEKADQLNRMVARFKV
jgi:methyl-accepting chemotaxis protein